MKPTTTRPVSRRRGTVSPPAWLLTVLLALTGACSSSGAPAMQTCRLNSDCGPNASCVNFVCTFECREDRDCDGGAVCAGGLCTPPGTDGGPAADGGATVDGGAPSDGGSPFDGGVAIDGGTTLDGGTTVDGGAGFDGGSADDGGSATGQYGDTCNGAGDCVTGLCVINKLTGGKICTIACTSEVTCQVGHACLPADNGMGGTTNVCVPSDAGSSCPSGQGTGCIYGLCLVHPASVGLSVCSTPCLSARACPAGFSCSEVSVSGGGTQRVCTPLGDPLSAQDPHRCTIQSTEAVPSSQCISRWCSVPVQSGIAGICTNNCRTAADCPEGWACGLDDAGPDTVINVCQPLATAAGAAITCFVDQADLNNCHSKTCAITSGSTGYCTAFCMNAAGTGEPARCPFGYQCIDADPPNGFFACERL